jgi:hypothetical protein
MKERKVHPLLRTFTKIESISKSSNSTTQINKGCCNDVVFVGTVTSAFQEENGEINEREMNIHHKEYEECTREV